MENIERKFITASAIYLTFSGKILSNEMEINGLPLKVIS